MNAVIMKYYNSFPNHFFTALRFVIVSVVFGLLFTSQLLANTMIREVRVIGVQDSIFQTQQAFFRQTVEQLNTLIEDRIYVLRPIKAHERFDMKIYAELDFAIVSPHVFSLLERYNGFKAMASLYVPVADQPQPVMSTVLYASKERLQKEDLLGKTLTLGDFAKRPIAVIAGDVCDTALLLRNEMTLRGLDLPQIHEAGRGLRPEQAIKVAKSGGYDAIAVSTDFVRELPSNLFDGLIPVDLRFDDASRLVSSTTPLPGWVFAAGLETPRDNVLDLTATLLSLAMSPTMQWGLPADYRAVHQAAERVKDEAYRSFQKKTLIELIEENLAWVLLGLSVVCGLVWHSIVVERMVRQRSAELMETVKKQRAAERQFEELERLSVVSQMSNIVAHELRQPLAAITNFAMGLRRRKDNGSLTDDSLEFALGRILSENERASDIVEHVRGYARRRERQVVTIDLGELTRKIMSSIKATTTTSIAMHCEMPSDLVVDGDTLEVELILRNLIKNAAESVAHTPDAKVMVRGERVVDQVKLVIEDNGPLQTRAALDRLAVPLVSEKSGGLGLGLSIVRKLIESYGGRIAFELASPTGLKVLVTLPVKPDLSSNLVHRKETKNG